MLDGKMPSSWSMFQKGEMATEDDPRFNQNPTIQDRMHCVLFVVNPEDIDIGTARWDFFRNEIESREIQALVVLPKIDLLDAISTKILRTTLRATWFWTPYPKFR